MSDAKDRGYILAIATIASFFVPYLTSSITVALPEIGREFSLDAVSLGWIMSSYVLSTAVCIVPCGRLADIYGRKRLFVAGVLLMTVASLLATFAWSASALILFRVVQGAGGAMIFTTSVTIVAAIFPPDQRGRALGITLASVYTGLSIGPFIGGILTTYFGWRSIFLVIIPLGLIVLWLTSTKIHDEWIDARGACFDLTGSILYGVSLFGVMYGLTLVPDLTAFGLDTCRCCHPRLFSLVGIEEQEPCARYQCLPAQYRVYILEYGGDDQLCGNICGCVSPRSLSPVY